VTYETATVVGCSILVLGGPIGLGLVAALIRRRDFDKLPVRMLVIGGILASGLIFWRAGPAESRPSPWHSRTATT